MSCYSKEKCGVEKYDYNNICKSHSARSDREKSSALTSTELYRICPSKLSKRELEDLYFALLENNLELKRTINGQQDKIRGLSTKVQRLNASQKLIQSKEMKDCCIGTKTLVNDQKESILDLKRTNQRMSERIRTLNMRLCSAKQFHKKSPSSSVSRCLRCANTSALPQHTYVKHSCSPKPSEPTNQTMKCSVSCQNVDRDATSVRSAQTEPREPQCQNSDLPCDENKCRTVMEELKQKIVTLQEELSNTHSEYSSRISRLEGEVSAVRRENVRVRGERGAGQDQLRGAAQRAAQLLDTCRQAEAKCVQLTAQLSIEKRKVAELETRLKAANMSNRVNKAIKDHFAHKNDLKPCAFTKHACPCPGSDWTQPSVTAKSGQKKTCDCDLDFESIIVTPAKISAQKSPRTDRGLPANKALEVETKAQVSQTAAEMEETPKADPGPEIYTQETRRLTDTGLSPISTLEPQVCCQELRRLIDARLPQTMPQNSEMYSQESRKPADAVLPSRPVQEPEQIYAQVPRGQTDTTLSQTADQEPQACCQELRRLIDTVLPQKIPQEAEMYSQRPRRSTDTGLPVRPAQEAQMYDQVPRGQINAWPPSANQEQMYSQVPRRLTDTGLPPGLGQEAQAFSQDPRTTRLSQQLAQEPEIYPQELRRLTDTGLPPIPAQAPEMYSQVPQGQTGATLQPRADQGSQELQGEVDTRLPPTVDQEIQMYSEMAQKLADSGLPSQPAQESEKSPQEVEEEEENTIYSQTSQRLFDYGLSEKTVQDAKVFVPEVFEKSAPSEVTSPKQGQEAEVQFSPQASEKSALDNDMPLTLAQDEKTLSANGDGVKDGAGPAQEPKGSTCMCLCPPREDVTETDKNGPDCVCACQPQQDLKQDSTSYKGSGCMCACPSQYDTASSTASNFVCGCPPRDDLPDAVQETNVQIDILRQSERAAFEEKTKKTLDDSGYVDANRSPDVPTERIRTSRQEYRKVSITETPTKADYDDDQMDISLNDAEDTNTNISRDKEEAMYLQKMNEQLMKTILDLQSQVDRMRIAGAKLAAGTCSAKKCGSKAAEGKSEDDAENCATNCGDDSPGCTMPIVESSKRQMEPQNENQFTPSINRSVEDYAPNKKVRQSETPSTSELEYGLQQEMQAAEQAAKPQSTNESFEKNRLFESLNYAAKVNVKPEFYTVDDRQQQLAGKKKVSTPQCLRCTRGAEFIADTDLLADKDSCEPCEFCSIEKKECQSKPPRDKGGKSDGGVAKGPAKSDRHNSLQIPGPIPVAEATTKDWKKNVFKRFSLDGKKKDPQKSKDEKRKRERDIENTTQRRGSGNMKDNADINNSLTNKMPLEIDENAKALREARRELKAHSKESFELNRLSTLKKKDSQTMPLPIQESLNNFYPRSDLNLFPTVGAEPNPRPTKYGNQTYHALTFQETNLQEQNRATQVGQENKQRRRSSTSDQETYTVDTSKETRATSPDNTEYEISYMTDLPSEREGKSPKSQRLSPGEDKMTTTYTDSYTNPATNYSLSEGELPATTTRKLSLNSRRDPAPLTNEDAPPTQKMEEALQAITEELARCKNLMLSQRPTDATSEATRTEATKPESLRQPRRSSPAMEPRHSRLLPLPIPPSPPSTPPSSHRQSLLNPPLILSQSSPRRSLVADLQMQHLLEDDEPPKRLSIEEASQPVPSQEMPKSSQQKSILHTDKHAMDLNLDMPDPSPLDSTIALRRGIATQSIGDTYAPKCLFTLHIGTVVLSDEAVLNSRDKSLVLTWKFYDQNVAMTRVRPGRVVLFDFSTEYDVKLTDEFLTYLKQEEMPILICELDKQDTPFASCALPLRDALLHTNRRADMSLALVAGPQMLSARAENGAAADALDAGDEMGVIDLWCLLRADGHVLPLINRSIARLTKPANRQQSSSRFMQQVMDDEPSNELRDLDITRSTYPVAYEDRPVPSQYRDVAYLRTTRRWGSSFLKLPPTYDINAVGQTAPPPPSKPTAAETAEAVAKAAAEAEAAAAATRRAEELYDPSNYPPVRQRNSDPPISPSDEPERDVSQIIPNEVVAKIKSPGDMKQALVQNSQRSDNPRIPRADEEIASQAQSSMGSLRSIVARLQKKGLAKTVNPNRISERRQSILQSIKAKSGKNTLDMVSGKPPPEMKPLDTVEEQPDSELFRKYDNISKLLGSNRTDSSKKSVTILPKYVEDETQNAPEGNEDENNPVKQSLDITVLWLALNEECEAMVDPHVQRVYVAYSFLGRNGAELETPVSLPKPKHYVDKCYFNFKKTFELEDSDLPLLGHMARCRAASKVSEDAKDCIVFSVVSEPPEDPLGLESCEDIGYAFLYLGDLLAYSAGSSGYTEVVPVRSAHGGAAVCGVLAVRLDGLDIVRRCLLLASSQKDLSQWAAL